MMLIYHHWGTTGNIGKRFCRHVLTCDASFSSKWWMQFNIDGQLQQKLHAVKLLPFPQEKTISSLSALLWFSFLYNTTCSSSKENIDEQKNAKRLLSTIDFQVLLNYCLRGRSTRSTIKIFFMHNNNLLLYKYYFAPSSQ